MIAQAFTKRPAFIAYLTLGDGGLDYSLSSALALVKGGVDILEIGLPFSDPVADGPVIQLAMERSLRAKTLPEDLIPFIQAFRQQSDVPIVVFSYFNPILAAGTSFLDRAKEAGANGILIVDLSHEMFPESSLDPILIVSTSTSQERIRQITHQGRGFIYYACQKGTTGMRHSLPVQFSHDLARIKQETQLPVVAGFGVSQRDIAAQILHHADGFVVGSYFVEAMARKASAEEITRLAQEIDPRGRS
jgi:tryptophan synthase alpha chain